MNETIFDIKELLPISIIIIPNDNKSDRLFGTVQELIPDVKLYLYNNKYTRVLLIREEFVNMPIGTKGLLVVSNSGVNYIFNNFTNTFSVITSNLFVIGYINGIKLQHFSNN